MAFGESTFSQIEYIVSGYRDFLTCLPEQLLLKIVLYLDLQAVTNLSHTNSFMHKFCNSNLVWSGLYSMYQAMPTREIFDLAKDLTWKAVFYMSKLQLQKELSRRKKQSISGHAKTDLSGTSNTDGQFSDRTTPAFMANTGGKT